MSSLLTWAPAARTDRLALRRFQCTEQATKRRQPGGGRFEIIHPAEWEVCVQSRIRTAKPPYAPPNHMWLGKDADGEIGAAWFHDELDGPGVIGVRLVGVAEKFRRRGGGCADELMTTLLDVTTERALVTGVHLVQILAYIDERNRPSQQLFRRFGFHQVADGPESLQSWYLELLVAEEP